MEVIYYYRIYSLVALFVCSVVGSLLCQAHSRSRSFASERGKRKLTVKRSRKYSYSCRLWSWNGRKVCVSGCSVLRRQLVVTTLKFGRDFCFRNKHYKLPYRRPTVSQMQEWLPKTNVVERLLTKRNKGIEARMLDKNTATGQTHGGAYG